MTLIEIHSRLADTATYFIAALAVWALILRLRSQPLEGGWIGAAIIGELLILGESLLGGYLYWQGLSGGLPRPFLHILYGIVAVVTLPATYAYFSNLEDENVKTIAMALVCAFLWGILLRASHVAQIATPLL
jgi:hypothetical protein